MSTILKALKKLEQDKLKKGEGRSEIAFDILKSSPRSRKTSAFPALTAGAALVLAAATGLFFLVGPHETDVRPVKSPSASVSIEKTAGETAEYPSPAKKSAATPVSEPEEEVAQHVSPQATQPTVEEAAPPETGAEARWVVSGIAWQEAEEQRLAVINGLPVMTGTAIDNASVVAIEQDRVVLSSGGEEITVALKLPRKD